MAPVLAVSLPQPGTAAWQVTGTYGWAYLTASRHCRVELRASSKDHKVVAVLVAWQRDTVDSYDI